MKNSSRIEALHHLSHILMQIYCITSQDAEHVKSDFCIPGCNKQLISSAGSSEKITLKASSQYNKNMGPEQSKINSETAGGKVGAWGPSGADVANSWIQVRYSMLKIE